MQCWSNESSVLLPIAIFKGVWKGDKKTPQIALMNKNKENTIEANTKNIFLFHYTHVWIMSVIDKPASRRYKLKGCIQQDNSHN